MDGIFFCRSSKVNDVLYILIAFTERSVKDKRNSGMLLLFFTVDIFNIVYE